MATATDLYLSPEQRNLLLAALKSNNQDKQTSSDIQQFKSLQGHNRSMSNDSFTNMPVTDQFSTPDMFNGDLDYLNGDFNYDFGIDGDEKLSSLDHDKRKHYSDDEDDDGSEDSHDTGAKRREGDDKTPKKPGRKPLNNEPTSKRKAQNRAAQRAFRERKEKHLKDLELKVIELEKKTENTDHENKSLRDQVETLQSELKSYRKRLSVGDTVARSPTTAVKSEKRLSGGNGSGGFSFEFPMFGQVGSHIFNNGSYASEAFKSKAVASPSQKSLPERSNSNANYGTSPQQARSNSNGSFSNNNATTSPRQAMQLYQDNHNRANSMNDLSNLFSPSILEAASKDGDYLSKGNSNSSMQSTPQLMGGMLDFSDSPSASSVSQSSSRGGNGNFESSCDTSPEPSMMSNSPMTYKPDMSFSQLNPIKEEGEHNKGIKSTNELSFCDQLAMACGTSSNPVPKADQIQSNSLFNTFGSAGAEPSFSWLAAENGNAFDPVLFNDYRDPINDINAGLNFFDEALPSNSDLFDFTSFPDTPAPLQQTNTNKGLLPELNDDEEEDEVMPTEDPTAMLSCNKIWNKIQSDPRLVNADLDMDNLCSELRAKAKCSESGPMIDKKDLEKVIQMSASRGKKVDRDELI